MRTAFGRLLADRRGNVALLLGLLAVPLLGLAGLAIDLGTAAMVKTQLGAAADSAALLATTQASNAYLAGKADPIAPATAAATQMFRAQAGRQASAVIGAVTVGVQQSGSLFTSSVAYTASVPTTLARLYGQDAILLEGHSAASLSVNPYVDIQVLMDVSSSMTIAATASDIARIQALTAAYRPTGELPGNVNPGEACAFACHWSTTGADYYALALKNNVQLRLNVLSAAVGNLIDNVAAVPGASGFRIGLYTFAEVFRQVYPLSTNILGARASLTQIAPDINDCSNNCPETYFAGAMSSFASIVGNSGNGGSAASSQKFLFIVGDGLVDQYLGSRQIGPIDPKDCAAVKAKGITVLTLYTPYLPLPTNAFYNQHVAPIQANIGPAMQACASTPALYFQANDAADIDAQLGIMLARVLQTSGHLTR